MQRYRACSSTEWRIIDEKIHKISEDNKIHAFTKDKAQDLRANHVETTRRMYSKKHQVKGQGSIASRFIAQRLVEFILTHLPGVLILKKTQNSLSKNHRKISTKPIRRHRAMICAEYSRDTANAA